MNKIYLFSFSFPGFHVRVIAEVPEDCKGDQMCGESRALIKANKESTSTYTLQAEVTNTKVELKSAKEFKKVAVSDTIKITDATFILKIGLVASEITTLYYGVRLEISDPKLILEGKQ